jgi:DNA-binding NtrC family response regulator
VVEFFGSIPHADLLKSVARRIVVDDDPDVLDMLVNSLNAMGYETLASRSGNEARETVRSNEKIDLLFTDVIMPGGLNGVELAQEARRLRPDLRVLLTTGFVAVGADAPAVVDETLRMLCKPYRQPELARMVRDALRS